MPSSRLQPETRYNGIGLDLKARVEAKHNRASPSCTLQGLVVSSDWWLWISDTTLVTLGEGIETLNRHVS